MSNLYIRLNGLYSTVPAMQAEVEKRIERHYEIWRMGNWDVDFIIADVMYDPLSLSILYRLTTMFEGRQDGTAKVERPQTVGT